MIGSRYLAVIQTGSGSAVDLPAPSGLVLGYRSPSVTVFSEAGNRLFELGPDRGVVLGTLFRQETRGHSIGSFDAGERSAIWGSRGKHLIEKFWGSYVALLAGGDGSVDILCAPMSHLRCYFIRTGSIVAVTSNVDLLVEAGLIEPKIDWGYVHDHLLRPAWRTARTGLVGVSELLWGQRLTTRAGNGIDVDTVWSPWTFAAPERRISKSEVAASTVRSAVEQSIEGWASLSDHILLGVSGGLDSSILAACLKGCGARFDLVTFVSDDLIGDEREFAKPLADSLGVPLNEAFECPETVDLAKSEAAHLPRPLARSFAQSGDKILTDLASEIGATAIWSGGGGDNVFCSLQSTVPVADRLRIEGPWRGALHTARNLSLMTGASIIPLLAKSIRRAWWRSPEYPLPGDATFLAEKLTEDVGMIRTRGWLEVPDGGLAGSAAHIAQIYGIWNFIEGHGRERRFPCVYPLLSQPVVEACLRVPSWLWCGPGLNRMIARIAFADRLPRLVVERPSKGSPGGFVMQIFETRRSEIATMLTTGHLARAGMLDLAQLQSTIMHPGPLRGLDYSRIMTLVDVEAWIGSWIAKEAEEGCS